MATHHAALDCRALQGRMVGNKIDKDASQSLLPLLQSIAAFIKISVPLQLVETACEV
jgi:hypothetical protein